MERKCMYCGTEITACFGFVLARDVLPVLEDGTMPYRIRESCGKCMFLIDLGILPRPSLDETSSEYQPDYDLIEFLYSQTGKGPSS